ncbi:unnamed protein product [Medioppia subpectinata]|uniref:Uncharacterized protein n=1 Tax=Medioppia subpectinata TaxID=1979941 RepID=A0A7R9L660_9ACAR|nr:unnamed protein product [Medioppia subpectinata]CAG2116061.1 unnamed protein product [Medioppia subpectinata]
MIIRDNKLLIKYTSGYQCFSRHFSISYKSKLMGIGPPLIISATNAIVITNGNQSVDNISYHSYNYYPIIDCNYTFNLIERRANINAPAHNIAYLANYGLIYWIDSVANSINMMDINYPHLTYTILQLNTGFARDLRINTMSEVLVWCEIGFNAGLWESPLDGTNRTAIYANPKHRQPFHLTVDYRQQRSLYSVDFLGGHEIYYMTSRPLLSSAVLGMNVFDSDLYLATDHVIYRIREPAMGVPEAELLYVTSGYDRNLDDKNGHQFYNTNPTDIKRDKIYEFQVIDPNGRFVAKNRCSGHSCRHVCVPSGQSYSCLTPDEPMPPMNDPSEPVVSPLIMNTCNSVDILSIVNTIVIAFMILLIVGLYLSVKKIVLTIEKRLFQVIIPTVTFKRVGGADNEDPPRKRLPEDHDYENNDRHHDYEIIDHDKRESG